MMKNIRSINYFSEIIGIIIGILILVGFFLPWSYAEIDFVGIEKLTGLDFFTSQKSIPGFNYNDLPFQFLLFVPIIGLIILFISIFLLFSDRISTNKNIKSFHILKFNLSVLTIILVFIYISLIVFYTDPSYGDIPQPNLYRYVYPIDNGLILTFVGGLLGLIVAYFNFRNHELSRKK